MTDHPAWRDVGGTRRRPFAVGGQSVVVDACEWDAASFAADLVVDSFALGQNRGGTFGPLLVDVGTVHRVRNPNLWDAIATAIIRQVIRAPHARRMYQEFCQAHGDVVVDTDGFEHWLMPAPDRVLELDDDAFTALGMAFKRKGLRSAASAYAQSGPTWVDRSPDVLVSELQAVPHIGPWTARAAVADFSNAWALYPYDDLAVRTWARRAMPDVMWAEGEAAFASQWRELGGEQIADITVLTLAWGDRHGGSSPVGTDRRA